MNSNIHPAEEYEHRRAVLLDFAREQGLEVIEGVYDPQAWSRAAGVFGTDPDQRPDRCRACYRLRLEEACAYAAANGFEGVATTLTVSPYQYTETIREELERACEPPWPGGGVPRLSRAIPRGHATQQGHGHVSPELLRLRVFQDRSRGRTRGSQSRARCCEGCQGAAEAPARAAAEAARQKKRAEKQAYANKRAAQRAALKAYKQAHHDDAACCEKGNEAE